MKLITDKEVAEVYGITKQGLWRKKKNAPEQYKVIRLGVIAKKHNITEEELLAYIQLKGTICNKGE